LQHSTATRLKDDCKQESKPHHSSPLGKNSFTYAQPGYAISQPERATSRCGGEAGRTLLKVPPATPVEVLPGSGGRAASPPDVRTDSPLLPDSPHATLLTSSGRRLYSPHGRSRGWPSSSTICRATVASAATAAGAPSAAIPRGVSIGSPRSNSTSQETAAPARYSLRQRSYSRAPTDSAAQRPSHSRRTSTAWRHRASCTGATTR
jgi:hypothetical protein